MEPIRYLRYAPGAKCYVDECGRDADYEVYLYDYYPGLEHEFYEQDFTCPFLCEAHMEENEREAEGHREPRGIVHYPHTNRHGAQGYTKYAPVQAVYPIFFDGTSQLEIPGVCLAFQSVNEELIRHLASHPELLRTLDPRKFEELVADIFHQKGFQVELTSKTRDGGKDLYAAREDSLGTTLYLIECKRYSSSQKVGVEIVRGLYGVTLAERATMGIIATTSTFTRSAVDFATPLRYQLSLRDYDALREWLNEYARSKGW